MPATRTWTSRGRQRCIRVETKHPEHGLLLRGWIRPAGVQDTTGPGLAGHLRWQLTDYDHTDLGVVEGDYVEAEKRLLEATNCLDS